MRSPSILVPYSGPDSSGNSIDVFLHLRPESNNVTTESSLLKIVTKSEKYHNNIKMVFLANFPGNYIRKEKIVENHYSYKLRIAKEGKKAFTPKMKEAFNLWFNDNFETAEITTPFETMEKLNITAKELFALWTDEKNILSIYSNTIKKYKDFYILNYDIPAILKKNTAKTDIAVMIFRSFLPWRDFQAMIGKMIESLRLIGVVKDNIPVSHIFHYTKSPFEQIKDGLEYLKDLEKISFAAYLQDNKYDMKKVFHYLENPVITIIDSKTGEEKENTIFEFTKGKNYKKAAEFLKTII